MPKKTASLPASEIELLTKEFQKANSFWRAFLKGLFMGVGSAIGAAVIAGLVIVLLSKMLSSLEQIPIFETLLEKSDIQSFLESAQP